MKKSGKKPFTINWVQKLYAKRTEIKLGSHCVVTGRGLSIFGDSNLLTANESARQSWRSKSVLIYYISMEIFVEIEIFLFLRLGTTGYDHSENHA